nr:integrase arm-type DNA-binding domain-containing protein [uncultured Cohaesibacter sp.]
MALSNFAIKHAKPKEQPYKLFDGQGLFLLVNPNGRKWWRHKYAFDGKEKLLSFGTYPEVSLKEARAKREDARKLLASGQDPSMRRKQESLQRTLANAQTFSSVAQELIEKREREGISEATHKKMLWFASKLEDAIGSRPVSEILPLEILQILRVIESRGNLETAKRVRAFASRVFRYAIITGRATVNPASDLAEAITSPTVKHYSAIIDPAELGGLLRAIDGFNGALITKLALQLTPHVFVRPGELRQAEWSEIDQEAAVWRIPAAKMKMRSEHIVPLSRQSRLIIKSVQAISSSSNYLFPSTRTNARPMSENTINAALRRMGFTKAEMTAHGFRSSASTLLNESGKWSSDAIERALAHKDSNTIRGIYHRGAHWQERVEMAQWWSDYLDALREGRKMLPFSAHSDTY